LRNRLTFALLLSTKYTTSRRVAGSSPDTSTVESSRVSVMPAGKPTPMSSTNELARPLRTRMTRAEAPSAAASTT
jgi:hypothetical protein